MFTLIDRWITDPLSSYSVPFADSSSIASSMASLLVAFPIYMLVMRVIISDVERHPEKIDDGVRKWLTYISLFIAASVVIGDLVAHADDLFARRADVAVRGQGRNGDRDLGRCLLVLPGIAEEDARGGACHQVETNSPDWPRRRA
jgi:hypothetical protein